MVLEQSLLHSAEDSYYEKYLLLLKERFCIYENSFERSATEPTCRCKYLIIIFRQVDLARPKLSVTNQELAPPINSFYGKNLVKIKVMPKYLKYYSEI